MTATSRNKPLTNQERFDKLRERIMELGTLLYEQECKVSVYDKTHLEVSAGGYIKYEYRGCDTPTKILDGMRATLKGMVADIKARRDELNDALETINDALEV